MKTRDLVKIGIPAACADTAKQILQKAQAQKQSMRSVTDDLQKVAASPENFVNDEQYGGLAQRLLDHAADASRFRPRDRDAGAGSVATGPRPYKEATRRTPA